MNNLNLRPEQRISAADLLRELEAITSPYEKFVEEIRPHKEANSSSLESISSIWNGYQVDINGHSAEGKTTVSAIDLGDRFFPTRLENLLVERNDNNYWVGAINVAFEQDWATALPVISHASFYWSGNEASLLHDILPEIEAAGVKDELDPRYPPLRLFEFKVDVSKYRALAPAGSVKSEEANLIPPRLEAALKLLPTDSDFFIINRPTIYKQPAQPTKLSRVQRTIGRLGL